MLGAALAPYPLVIALLGAIVLLGASRWLPRRAVDAIAIASSTLALAACAGVAVVAAHAPIVYWVGGWTPHAGVAIGIVLHVEPFGAALGVLECALMTGALVYSSRYFRAFEGRYHALMLLFLAAMIGFSYSLDLFNILVWFEVMSVTAFALTGFHHEESSAIQGGINFAFTNSIGSFASLFGIGLLYAHTGALDLPQIGSVLSAGRADPWIAVALVFICVGLLVKAAIVPFHFWLADAHAVAPTPVCVLFSGVMVELGLYGIARIYWSGFAGAGLEHAFSALLVGAGALTVVIGSVMCFGQKHVKRMLAYSTIAHAGIILVAVGALDPRGLAGAVAYIAAHGFTKAALFLCAGLLIHRFAGINEGHLHAAARDMRGTFVLLLLATASLAGAPPFGTFHARALIDESLRASHLGWLTYVLTFGTVLTCAAVLRAGLRIFLGWGPPPRASEPGDHADVVDAETYGPRGRIPVRLWAPGVAFIGAAAGLGAAPRAWQQAVLAYAARFTAPQAYAHEVLGAPTPPPVTAPALHEPAQVTWIVTVLAAAALAIVTTRFGHRIRYVPGLRLLRRIHDGDVGEYASWLLVGITALVATLVYLAG